MNASISTEPYSCGPSPAPLQRKGKPVAGIHSGPAIPNRPDKPHHSDKAQDRTTSHHWQGDIDNGPFDCNVSLQPKGSFAR